MSHALTATMALVGYGSLKTPDGSFLNRSSNLYVIGAAVSGE